MSKKDRKFLVIIITFGIIMINIFLIPKAFRSGNFNPEGASQYGSFIGGYLGPFITLISVALLYLTLKNQNDNFILDKIENRFFELVKLHRDNVNEISINKSCGRKVFVILIREFREVYYRVNEYFKECKINMEVDDKLNISYLIFFYGTGPNSDRVLKSSLKDFDEKIINELLNIFRCDNFKSNIKVKRNFNYTPFEGHQSRLGHYYRHLYQSVVFIDKQTDHLSEDEKYSYIKILRAQLSTHEQALLFLNSQSDVGKKWRESNLICKYRLIKNLPNDFFDEEKEINIKKKFQNLEFEWEQ